MTWTTRRPCMSHKKRPAGERPFETARVHAGGCGGCFGGLQVAGGLGVSGAVIGVSKRAYGSPLLMPITLQVMRTHSVCLSVYLPVCLSACQSAPVSERQPPPRIQASASSRARPEDDKQECKVQTRETTKMHLLGWRQPWKAHRSQLVSRPRPGRK